LDDKTGQNLCGLQKKVGGKQRAAGSQKRRFRRMGVFQAARIVTGENLHGLNSGLTNKEFLSSMFAG